MLDKLIKALVRYKIHRNPEWLATSFGIDEKTDIHVIVEKWRNGRHFYGTREVEKEMKETIIRQYRKKPVVIEAMQYTIKHYKELKDWAGDNVTMQLNSETSYQVIDNTAYPIISPIIHTLEGDMKVDNGDYVIKGINGEFYPCKPDIFEKTYEAVESPKEEA